MKSLTCYKHDQEVYRRDNLLWHIQENLPVLCDDQLFICAFKDNPYTRDGVMRRLALDDPIVVIERLKKEKTK